ncbi:hypothetical protein AAC387_Pa01g2478 [Persea americana]
MDPASSSVFNLQATTSSTHLIGLVCSAMELRFMDLGIFNERYRVHLPLGKWRRRFRQFNLMMQAPLPLRRSARRRLLSHPQPVSGNPTTSSRRQAES